MSAEQKQEAVATPIKLSNKEAWPFDLVVLDAAGVEILSERRAAHSSRDRTVEDLMDAVHFHREGREAAREANHEQLARWEFIVAAVNSFASSQGRIAQLEAQAAEAVKVIEPFADEADLWPEEISDEFLAIDRQGSNVTLADIRAARAFLAGAQPLEPEGEWIDWAGGECPVAADVRVQYLMADGHIDVDPRRADSVRWDKSGLPGDIIAYRIVGAAK